MGLSPRSVETTSILGTMEIKSMFEEMGSESYLIVRCFRFKFEPLTRHFLTYQVD